MGIEKPDENTGGLPLVLTLLHEAFPDGVSEIFLSKGDAVAVVSRESLKSIMQFLKDDSRLLYNVLLDVTAVDNLGREPRFEVVYHVLSMSNNQRLRIKVGLPGDQPAIESMTGIWNSADWLEREVWDMFGIQFTGHPDLRRILLYPEFQGHPLRKDYPIRRRQPLVGPKN